MALRVVLCDDAIGFPDLVASWLQDEPGIELVAAVGSATELRETLPHHAPDMVLLDLMLPEGQTGPELVDHIRATVPGVRVVLVSSLPKDLLGGEVVRTGADGAVPKATTSEQLRAAILEHAAEPGTPEPA
ncbi:MAG TPA: response regulator transcription factor [Solirubrobacteraceae bacterium]|nr:response regulator transcription factor [Solirubrobacteraceae bacterium]